MHIMFCLFEKEKLKKFTKPFCVLFLAVALTIAVPSNPLVYIPFYLACVGDFFLIKVHKKTSYFIGTTLFLIGHLCLFFAINRFILECTNVTMYLIGFGVIIALSLILFIFNHKMCGLPTLEGNFYMFLLVALIGSTVYLVIKNAPKGGDEFFASIMLLVGYVLFFISDVLVIISTYVHDFRRRDLPIMITYLVGQFLIVYGLIVFAPVF